MDEAADAADLSDGGDWENELVAGKGVLCDHTDRADYARLIRRLDHGVLLSGIV